MLTPFESIHGATLPPTSAGPTSTSDSSSSIWLVSISLLAFLGSMLAIVIRRRKLA